MAIGRKTKIGQNTEQEVCRFLETKGLTLVTKNFRSFNGEIDLIMKDRDDIVFVEVRTRNHQDFGSALESVDYNKQRRIYKTAVSYLQKERLFDKINCRFDVIGVSQGHIEWIKNAFSFETL